MEIADINVHPWELGLFCSKPHQLLGFLAVETFNFITDG
jgi:hypothetical protein